MLIAVLSAQLLLAAAPAERAQLLVQDLTVGAGIDPGTVTAITESLGAEIDRRGYFKSVTSKDVQTLLGVERQKQLVGCNDASSSCLSELAGALGAPYVLSGSVSKLGSAIQLTLQMLDVGKAQTVARAIRIANDVDSLRATIPWALAEATGTPPPPLPSKLPAMSLVIGGGAVLVGGLAYGGQALLQERDAQTELHLGETSAGVLDTPSHYQKLGDDLARQKTLGLAGIALGAVLVGAGIYLWPATPGGGGGQVAFVPLQGGGMFAFSFTEGVR
ncbi:MAG: hypothetical protein ACJ790_20600 [Myxococcaceae bacterium]